MSETSRTIAERRRSRLATASLGLIALTVLVVGGIGLWRIARPDARVETVSPSVADETRARSSGADAAGLRIRLLPDRGIGAEPATVRLGIAQVSAQDAAEWRAWVRGGMRGAGPQRYADMATVARWIPVQTRRLADGTVEIGARTLPVADLYVLQAASMDRLRWYDTRFVAGQAPAEVRPRLASGVRVHRADASTGPPRLSVLLRRVDGSRDAGWQPLLRQVAPQVLAAYDDTPLPVGDAAIAPLPPGPVEAVVLAEGVEVMRRRFDLIPGRIATLAVAADALRSGSALATTLRLRLIDADTGRTLRPAQVRWIAPDGERRLGAEADGSYRIAQIDPARPLRFDLSFDADDDGLPQWPERMPLLLPADDDPSQALGSSAYDAATGELLRTVPVQPLRWLVVEGLPAEARMRGDTASAAAVPSLTAATRTPPPVYVLETLRPPTRPAMDRAYGDALGNADGWRAVAADAFRPLPGAVAASIQAPGRYRVAVAISPWRILRSAAVDIPATAPRRLYRARLIPPERTPRQVRLRLIGESGPLVRVPVQVVDAAGALPPWTLTTDTAGVLRLDAATEAAVHLEAHGHAQTAIGLDAAQATVRLRREAD